MHSHLLRLWLHQVCKCPISQSKSWPSQQQGEEVEGLPKDLDEGMHNSLGAIVTLAVKQPDFSWCWGSRKHQHSDSTSAFFFTHFYMRKYLVSMCNSYNNVISYLIN